jgi:hypothetical protein
MHIQVVREYLVQDRFTRNERPDKGKTSLRRLRKIQAFLGIDSAEVRDRV